MRSGLSFSVFVLLLLSCSKEENIPFQEADHITIEPKYYHKLEGHYVGTLSEIEFISDTAYIVNAVKAHEIEITELDFDHVNVLDISNRIASNAVAEIGRVSDYAYVRFEQGSMNDSLSIDSVYYNYYNGVYAKADKYFEYYIRYKSNNIVVHELFKGNRN